MPPALDIMLPQDIKLQYAIVLLRYNLTMLPVMPIILSTTVPFKPKTLMLYTAVALKKTFLIKIKGLDYNLNFRLLDENRLNPVFGENLMTVYFDSNNNSCI